jgi:hypothetical protein
MINKTLFAVLTLAASLVACSHDNPAAPSQPPPPTPLYQLNGNGNQVFDVPRSVSRLRVIADYAGSCQNFIMHIGGRSIANEILGSCAVAIGRHYEATVNTTGGAGETVNSSGVSWQITELR